MSLSVGLQVLLTVRVLVSLLTALQRRPLRVLLEETESFGVLYIPCQFQNINGLPKNIQKHSHSDHQS